MVAEEDDLGIEASYVRVAPLALGLEPPLENRPWDVEGAGDDTVSLPVCIGADVDQLRAATERGERLPGLEAHDLRPGLGEHLLESPSALRHTFVRYSP